MSAAGQFRREDRAMVQVRSGVDAETIPIDQALEGACATFEAEAGGREALVAHLSHGRLEPREEVLVGAIADPRNDGLPLARICVLYGIQFSTLLALFRDAGFAKAQLAAMQRVWKLVPDLAEDVMVRALAHQVPCGPCHGSGAIKSTILTKDPESGKISKDESSEECGICLGKGEVTQQPEREQQKLALQLSGLLPTGGGQPGVQVNVSQKTAVGVRVGGGIGGGDVFSSFLAASDKVLYPELPAAPAAPAPVEAEIIEDSGEEEV